MKKQSKKTKKIKVELAKKCEHKHPSKEDMKTLAEVRRYLDKKLKGNYIIAVEIGDNWVSSRIGDSVKDKDACYMIDSLSKAREKVMAER